MAVDVRWVEGKGRCLWATAAMPAGSLVLQESPLVVTSPSAEPEAWARLSKLHEEAPLPVELEWYLGAGAVVASANADAAVAAAIADKFRPDPAVLGESLGTALDILRVMEALQLEGLVGPEDFVAALAVVRFNAFRVAGAEGAIALFDRASMMAHSCCPSAGFDFDGSGRLSVRTLRSLDAGEEVTISYLPVFALWQSTEMRRLKLEDRLFTCHCARCEWPADLSRGFRCSTRGCLGVCFMPRSTTCFDCDAPSASLPCSACGAVLGGAALEEALEHEARYGFVVEFGSMAQDAATALGLAQGAVLVFRQHWILAAIAEALLGHHRLAGAEAEAEACRRELAELRAAACAPWPWLAVG